MHKKLYERIRSLFLPRLVFSVITGFLSALLIIAFKILAEWVIHLSGTAYEAVRTRPLGLPLLVLCTALIGLMASLILSRTYSCRGGGIPSSVAAIKGMVSFRWIHGVILLPISALLTFLAGLPLGTEGPCVQMGTAVGAGVMKGFGKEKHRGWRRYIMTGGASAGFSIATASPISAIIFAMEELHKHFSPILLSVASMSVITAQITAKAFASIGIGDMEFIKIAQMDALPLSRLFIPILLGVIIGVVSIFFTRLYHLVDRLMRIVLKKISIKILFPVLFAAVSVIGYFFADSLGSGHSLIHALFTRGAAWYLLILLFLVRAMGMMICNTSGATGGVFLPTLAFGAIIGALCADAMISLGWIGEEYYVLLVMLGITAFLGATSRIPLTACVFGVEAFGGIYNILPMIIVTTVALLIVESSGLEDLTDKIIDAKLHAITKGKTPHDVEVPLTVQHKAFVVGKELRDVLWPNSCVVVSVTRARTSKNHAVISEGDVITVRYVTYDPTATALELKDLVGAQAEDITRTMLSETA